LARVGELVVIGAMRRTKLVWRGAHDRLLDGQQQREALTCALRGPHTERRGRDPIARLRERRVDLGHGACDLMADERSQHGARDRSEPKGEAVRMTHRGRSRRTYVLGALASLAALLPLAPVAAAPDTDIDTQAHAGMWTGMTQTVRSRSTMLLSAGYTARGEYWFRIDKAGNVTGYAVVAFEPTADLSGLNARVDAAKDIAGTFLGAIGSLLGPAEVGMMGPELSISTLLGARVDWTDPMLVLRGPISGRMAHGGLSLQWANKQPGSIPATLVISYLKRDEPVSKGGKLNFPIDTPWPGEAAAVDPKAQHMVASGTKPSSKGEVSDSTSWAWTAHLNP
jgi:hypothetical protein